MICLYFQAVGAACAVVVTVTRFRDDDAVRIEDVCVAPLGGEIDPPVEIVTPLSEDVRPAVPVPAAGGGLRGDWEDGGKSWVPEPDGGGYTPYHQASPSGPAGDENGGETPSVELGNPGDDATQMLTKAF
jgi:hypothetical protein